MKKVAVFRTTTVIAIVACLSLAQLQVRGTTLRTSQLNDDNLEQILLSYNDAQKLLQVLEKVLNREPRQDAPGLDDPSNPISPFDSADLDAIRRCVCIIKEQLKKVCSKLEKLDDDLSIHDALMCSKVGQLDAEGSCFEDPQTIPDGINDAQLNVIQWLKSIMLTLYGCTEPIPVDGGDPFVSNPFS